MSRRRWLFPFFQSLVLPIQVRTRLIDLAVVEFVEGGGRQVLLLGAGFDARAVRVGAPPELGLRFFEVDHKATQQLKRARIPESPSVFVPWDFETQPVADLPKALAAVGHDPAKPTLTIWEGVTMYLSEAAVDASVLAVRALSAKGSPFVFTYVDQATLARHRSRWATAFVGWRGEPLTLGFDPAAMPSWLAARGLALRTDASLADAGQALLPERYAGRFFSRGEHVVLATCTE